MRPSITVLPRVLPTTLHSHHRAVNSSLKPLCYQTRPFGPAFCRGGRTVLRFPKECPPTLGWETEPRAGWEEPIITLIKGSSCVSIESVQKSAEQVEGGGREGAAGHEVKRNEGEDNPGVTLEVGRGGGGEKHLDSGTCQRPPRPLVAPLGRVALTDEVRHKQEDIFLRHRSGLLSSQGRGAGSASLGGSSLSSLQHGSPQLRAGPPDAPAGPRCESWQPARAEADPEGRGAPEGARTTRSLGAEPHPGHQRRLQLFQLCSASGNSELALAKSGERKRPKRRLRPL